jgi:4-amino-4-deoxy-L-arabinose transferase-like glycosyltransferase
MKRLIVLFLLLLALVLRFYQLDRVPPSLYWDETSIGYNAWSIATTGRDEHGSRYPYFFKAFGEYKLPGYIYSSALFTKFLGPSPWAVRLPSAIYGVLTVILTYFLVKELFDARVGLLAGLFLAISPWHLSFSRAGFEANGALFFQIATVYLFVKGLSCGYWLPLSALGLLLAVSFYHTQKVFLPLILLLIFWLRRSEYKQKPRWLMLAGLMVILGGAFLIRKTFSTQGLQRYGQVSFFQDVRLIQDSSLAIAQANNAWWARIFYNRRLVYLRAFVANYTSHFSLPFLFIRGDGNLRHGVAGLGLMELWQLPFFLVGLAWILRDLKFASKVILAWLILAPIPAGLSLDAPHALRSLAVLPIPQIIVALGVVWLGSLVELVKRSWLVFLFAGGTLAMVIFGAVNTWVYYFHFGPSRVANAWGDGYPQLMAYLKDKQGEYDLIYVTGEYWQPYIYALFYLKYPPADFQVSGNRARFANFYFGPTEWDEKRGEISLEEFAQKPGRALVALSPKEYDQRRDQEIYGKGLIYLEEINNSFGQVRFVVAELGE